MRVAPQVMLTEEQRAALGARTHDADALGAASADRVVGG